MDTPDTPKWKVTENVVAAIERSLNIVQGARVIHNASVPERISGAARQVDVYVVIPTGPRELRVGVEVRDKSCPVDLPEVEQLIAKLKKLDIDYGCIVSAAGFTASAKGEAERNGIEIRTVAEVGNPDWWHPSTMPIHHQQVELLHLQVNFQPEELARITPLLADVAVADLEITFANGETRKLHDVVAAEGVRVVDQPERTHLKNEDIFTVKIDFTQLHGASLKYSRGPLPMPSEVWARYRLHVQVESVKLAAYQGPKGINIFTGVSASLRKQITWIIKPQPDGSRSISIATDDPSPPKTVVSRREEDADQNRSPDLPTDASGQ